METASESVQVNIFNQVYRLRSPGGAERVTRLAQLVDERMRLIASQLSAHDVAKVAVLAALNIADELENLRDDYERDLEGVLARPATGESKPDLTEGSAERRSWFEEIFDSEVTPKRADDRLSDRVSTRLQALRRASQEEGITIEAEDS